MPLRPLESLFLGSLTLGAVIGVRAMLTGIERRGGAVAPADPVVAAMRPHAPQEPAVRLALPALAAFLLLFGFVGYLLTRDGREIAAGIVVAAMSGSAAAIGVVWVARSAAAFVPEHDEDDPRFVLQGHPARVVEAIAVDRPGRVAFEVDGLQRSASAVAIDGRAVAAESDVVIERLDERGVAHVEPWVYVEQRL